MINRILEFAVRQRMLVFLGAAILAAFGVMAWQRIPIDAFPDVTTVQVQILASAGGMSPLEVEKLITRPIEIEMGGLPRMTEVRSVSKIGLSMITVVFEDGVDDYFARQLVFERMQSVREKLPKGVDVELGPITTGLGEVFQYTLVSKDPKIDATELRTLQDYIVRPLLRTVPGVADVSSFGGRVKQYQVIVNPDRLTSFKVSLQQLFEALQKNNANANGNFIDHGSEQYIVQGLGLVKDTADIGNIVVATHEGTPIFVHDLAEVKIGAELRQGVATADGKGEVCCGIVQMLKGASGRDVVNAVKEKLPALMKALAGLRRFAAYSASHSVFPRWNSSKAGALAAAEMIHDADLEDGKFQRPECTGLDLLFKGWARLGLSDAEILEKGFACFDGLHASLRKVR